jgi:hypothetical protein
MFPISKLLSAVTQLMFWLPFWWGIALLLLQRWLELAVVMPWTGCVG